MQAGLNVSDNSRGWQCGEKLTHMGWRERVRQEEAWVEGQLALLPLEYKNRTCIQTSSHRISFTFLNICYVRKNDRFGIYANPGCSMANVLEQIRRLSTTGSKPILGPINRTLVRLSIGLWSWCAYHAAPGSFSQWSDLRMREIWCWQLGLVDSRWAAV